MDVRMCESSSHSLSNQNRIRGLKIRLKMDTGQQTRSERVWSKGLVLMQRIVSVGAKL